jgi:hypothetical protein
MYIGKYVVAFCKRRKKYLKEPQQNLIIKSLNLDRVLIAQSRFFLPNILLFLLKLERPKIDHPPLPPPTPQKIKTNKRQTLVTQTGLSKFKTSSTTKSNVFKDVKTVNSNFLLVASDKV